jgi:hypothetical protein
MSEEAVLIEKSFADAIAMIAASEELREELKRHWTTSLRQFAKAMDRPLEIIPARYSAVRNELAKWHHAPSGLTPKTVMNQRSNTKRALLYLSREKGIPEHGAPDPDRQQHRERNRAVGENKQDGRYNLPNIGIPPWSTMKRTKVWYEYRYQSCYNRREHKEV